MWVEKLCPYLFFLSGITNIYSEIKFPPSLNDSSLSFEQETQMGNAGVWEVERDTGLAPCLLFSIFHVDILHSKAGKQAPPHNVPHGSPEERQQQLGSMKLG